MVKECEAAFPLSLADEVFSLLKARNINCIRYCDLKYKESHLGSRYRYADEFIRASEGKLNPWTAFIGLLRLIVIRKGEGKKRLEPLLRGLSRSRDRPVAILQHDADMLPQRTLQMIEKEKQYGLLSSSYFFKAHADPVSYELDIELMKQYESEGFEIGYHQNAYERAHYNKKAAFKLVDEEVAYFAKHFNLRSFVPHGGTPGPNNINNEKLPQYGPLKPLLWAFNGKCILKHYTWSDGGMKKRAPSDPRKFVQQLRPGTRAMILMHPQYYGNELRHDWEQLPVSKHQWWRDLWNL